MSAWETVLFMAFVLLVAFAPSILVLIGDVCAAGGWRAWRAKHERRD